MERARIKLSNNAILLYEQRDLPVTSVVIASKVGSAYEDKNIKGISHFLEHIVFKGTSKRSQQDIVKGIEKVGGELNAFTHYEITAFHAKVPSKYFYEALDILADMTQNPSIPEIEVEKERKVIFEEIKMNHDNPKRFLYRKVFECLYEKPFGMPIIGFKNSLAKINRKKLLEWHKSHYATRNFIISVIGNNDIDEVKKAVEEKILLNNKLNTKKFQAKKICKNFVEKRSNLKQAHLAFSIHLPTARSKFFYANEIINAILGEGMSSWLFQEVREKRGLAYTAHSELDYGNDFSYLMVYIGTAKDKVKECSKIVEELIKKLKNVSKDEIKEAKEKVIGNFEIRREKSLQTAIDLLYFELFGKYEDYYKFSEKIEKVNREQIKNLFKEVIGVSKVFVLPK